MNRSSCFRALCVLCAAVICGCAQDAGSGADAVARDTIISHRGSDVAVTIVENTPDTVQDWRVDEIPALDLGGGDSERESLYRVRGAYRLQDGRIVVADGGSTQLRFFDPSGAIDTIVGGAGEGPGEFRNLTWFGRLPGDSLFVWDFGLRRVTIFDARGSRIREFRNDTPSSISGVFDDGSMYAQGFINLGGREPSGLERHSAAALRVAADGSRADSLGSVKGSEAFFVSFAGGFSVYTAPFARTTKIVVAGDRLYIGDTDRPEIHVSSADRTPLLIVRWAETPRPIGSAEVEQARQRELAGDISDATRESIESMYREMPMPETMPAFEDMRVDRDGNIWVKRYRTAWDEGPAAWLVFDGSGRFTTAVALPAALQPTDIGPDHVLGIERDELDVEHVKLYRLVRR